MTDSAEKNRILDEMWDRYVSGSMGTCCMCNTCGGSSTSFCNCAKERYFRTVTEKEIDEYKKKTQKPSTEGHRDPRAWDYMRAEFLRNTNMNTNTNTNTNTIYNEWTRRKNEASETYHHIIRGGTFYNPALKHYNKENGSVNCDRCKRRDLPCCIGLEDQDLCMDCVAILKESQ